MITLDLQLVEVLYAGVCILPDEDDLHTVWCIRADKYIDQTITVLIPPDHPMREELETYLPDRGPDDLDEWYREGE